MCRQRLGRRQAPLLLSCSPAPASRCFPRARLPSQETHGTSRRFATTCSSAHCGRFSNSACPNMSAGGRFTAKEPPPLGSGRSPHCLRAKRVLAIAIVTRRAETPVGWLGEERSDE